MGNHRVGGVQDGLGGAVVLLQPDDPGAPVLLLKAEDVFNGGAPEAVDALVVVTHHADIFITPGQQGGQQVLHVVGILVLVHQDVAEFPLVVCTDVLIFLQELDCLENDVVKVQGVVLF